MLRTLHGEKTSCFFSPYWAGWGIRPKYGPVHMFFEPFPTLVYVYFTEIYKTNSEVFKREIYEEFIVFFTWT